MSSQVAFKGGQALLAGLGATAVASGGGGSVLTFLGGIGTSILGLPVILPVLGVAAVTAVAVAVVNSGDKEKKE